MNKILALIVVFSLLIIACQKQELQPVISPEDVVVSTTVEPPKITEDVEAEIDDIDDLDTDLDLGELENIDQDLDAIDW